ncbi:MAG: helix-turn-helix transcriptional regulator [Rhodobacteraceae bacterium]|nr:helix-turn-helix transcriptional regulator [Paracoccaceae bacterium]MBR9823710.1 helix-turn-helix transcriptional regulator [Paracoccaceae bacterium]
MTQTAIAEAADLSRGFLSEIISGKKDPSMATLRRIADAIGCSVADLYQDQPNGPPRSPREQGEKIESIERIDDDQMSRHVTAMAQQLGAQTSGKLEVYRVLRHYPSLQLMRGDLVIAEQGASRPLSGQFAVAEITSHDRSMVGMTLVSGTNDGKLLPIYGEAPITEDQVVGILATAVCSIRPPQLSI